MANPEQLALLKSGVAEWNTWINDHADVRLDLREADLREADLSRADLGWADLTRAYLSWADLSRANLSKATLSGANLSQADLSMADLREANLTGAHLREANLSMADLREANLSEAILSRADLSEAILSRTLFINMDLSTAKGLDTCNHFGPSTLDHRTLAKGPLPLAFLRGVGLPDRLIEYLPSLLGEAIQFYACFISYSARDDDFARRLHADLQDRGVRCWFAPEDLKIGERIRVGIDDAIKVHDKLLLILSEHSIASQWVEQEVEDALEQERQTGKTILFPIRLDDTIMSISSGWPRLLRNTRNIGDMRQWKDHDAYQRAFERLLRDLRAESAPPVPSPKA